MISHNPQEKCAERLSDSEPLWVLNIQLLIKVITKAVPVKHRLCTLKATFYTRSAICCPWLPLLWPMK